VIPFNANKKHFVCDLNFLIFGPQKDREPAHEAGAIKKIKIQEK